MLGSSSRRTPWDVFASKQFPCVVSHFKFARHSASNFGLWVGARTQKSPGKVRASSQQAKTKEQTHRPPKKKGGVPRMRGGRRLPFTKGSHWEHQPGHATAASCVPLLQRWLRRWPRTSPRAGQILAGCVALVVCEWRFSQGVELLLWLQNSSPKRTCPAKTNNAPLWYQRMPFQCNFYGNLLGSVVNRPTSKAGTRH